MTGFTMRCSSTWTLRVAMVAVLAWAGSARAAGEEGDEYSIRWTNGLSTPDLRFNALSANPAANPEMVLQALRTDVYRRGTGNRILREQLGDPSARAFMKYVVECALTPAQQVQWEDPTGSLHRFNGHLGLCPAWQDGPPSPHCQRLVSACVLARNNAEGKRVLFSGRGDKFTPGGAFAPKPQVTADPYRGYTRTVVDSMVECSPFEIGIHRNCGFETERVGTCAPGTPVSVGGGGVPPAASCGTAPLGATLAGTMMLRVCEGLHACNELRALAQSAITCSTYLPAVSFMCPTSGVFSVMSGSRNSAETGELAVAALGAAYPATEQQIFKNKEGAFYGILWGPGALAPGVNVYVDDRGVLHKDVQNIQISGSIYPRMYACQAPTWSDTDAYANERLCTLSGVNCVAQPMGRCDAPVGTFGRRCQYDNATGNGDYSHCVGYGPEVYTEVVTPYLKDACDNVSDPLACAVAQD